jgi:hypothetical protein
MTFRAGLPALAEAGKLRFWKLALDGRPVAMLFAVVEGARGWLGKIAYDERLARFSPGVLLVLQATRSIFEEGLVEVDSCAIPGHPMIDRLWAGRIALADVLVAGPQLRRLDLELLASAETCRRKARAGLRDLYHTLTGRHRS